MRKKLRFLFFIGAITVGGILLFQCYWVYNTYKTGEQNLNKLLAGILQRSIDNYQVQQINLPASLNGKSPHLDVMEWKTMTAGSAGKNGAILKFNQVSIDSGDIARVKLMMAQLLSAKEFKPVHLDILKQFFSDELRKSNFRLSFRLLLRPYQQHLPENMIAGYINLSDESPIIIAVMNDTSSILLKQNLFPAIISLTLILLSGGSLFYMWTIIRRQIRFDDIKNAVISNIAHEFRTPLSILKSTHEILIDFGEINDPEKTARYLKTNRGILQKLDMGVDRILDITQLENSVRPSKNETINIIDLVSEIVARFTIKEAVQINCINDGALTSIITDGYIIDIILTNLIDNAIKYAGRKVQISIALAALKNGWQLSVEDNGRGIEKTHLPFIFDKFYRVPAGDLHDVKGYGLGLNYVRELAGSINGKIAVSSKINAGTTFTIKFLNP